MVMLRKPAQRRPLLNRTLSQNKCSLDRPARSHVFQHGLQRGVSPLARQLEVSDVLRDDDASVSVLVPIDQALLEA